MWIVKLALRRPYTFAVMAIAILIAGFASFRQTPKDIFPEIDIPVISVIWIYDGLSVEEFESQIKGFSARDVNTAINAQNLTLPSGTAKIGDTEYRVKMNNSPNVLDALNNVPIKVENGVVTYVRDVAHVRDGFEVQPSIARADGKRAVLLQILKNGHSSTLDIIKAVKAKVPETLSSIRLTHWWTACPFASPAHQN